MSVKAIEARMQPEMDKPITGPNGGLHPSNKYNAPEVEQEDAGLREFNEEEADAMSRRVPLHEEELLRALLTLSTGQERLIAMQDAQAKAAANGNKTSLPNWLMPILVGILIALLGFVYTTVDRRMTELKNDQSTLQLQMQNTREQLIRNGWRPDAAGNLMPPDSQVPSNRK